jgi:hypothetical protein
MKNQIYVGKIRDFIQKNDDDLLSTFKNGFWNVYGEDADIQQINAWKSSIAYLKQVFNNQNLLDFDVTFEYRLPFSNERIDLLIFGANSNGNPAVIVAELKGWTFANKVTDFLVRSNIGISSHPEYQLENYIGKLRFSHSESKNFNFSGCVLFYNADKNNININFNGNVFFKNDTVQFQRFIIGCLKTSLDNKTIEKFLNGTYIQNKQLFDSIKNHFEEIKQRSYETLAQNGWGLSEEQLKLIEEIIADLRNGKKDIIYLVQGAPGSGKTLVAIHLMLSALSLKYQTILAYRNNRLINSIREIFDSIQRGLSNPIKFYSVGPRARFRGVAEQNFNGSFDLVIYDEAQRMTKRNITYAVQRGRITVFFYDEGQILNAEEEGTTENFKYEAQKQGKYVKERYLKGFYRVQGGETYHAFVEKLITGPVNINKDLVDPWKKNYDFRVFTDFDEMYNALKSKAINNKVALIAAFTESPGDFQNHSSIKNLRIGYPLYSGLNIYKNFNKKIYWLMDPKRDYVPFWVRGESNKLDKCASIYGCQGFETDYAGIIWGRDYVIRNNKWEVGDNCEDNIGKPSLKDLFSQAKNGNKEAKEKALFLLKNRYRIFLTRGIKGTYIICEDKETAELLNKIYNDYVT